MWILGPWIWGPTCIHIYKGETKTKQKPGEYRLIRSFIENNFLRLNTVLQSNSDDWQAGLNVVVVVGFSVIGGKFLKPGIWILKVIYHTPCSSPFEWVPEQLRDHPFKTSANFDDFWPLPPYHRHSTKMLMKGIFDPYVRDIHIECSKQFKWKLYFYRSWQRGPFWSELKLL